MFARILGGLWTWKVLATMRFKFHASELNILVVQKIHSFCQVVWWILDLVGTDDHALDASSAVDGSDGH